MKNQQVAELLYNIADLLDIKGEMVFKIRAYRIAAQTIETLEEDIDVLVKEKRLETLRGIGEALAKKITEYVETGRVEYYEKLKKEMPEGLLALLNIPGLGPKKAAALYKNLHITSIEQLKKFATDEKLRDLEGFGITTEQNILRGIQLLEKTKGRVLLNVAYEDGNNLLDYLKTCKQVKKVDLAGSLRRMKETIGDIDVLAMSNQPEQVMECFIHYPGVERVLAKGATKTSVHVHGQLQVDLRVVPEKSYGAALQYFTGSKDHNVILRGIAIKKGYKLNEYGLFDKKTDKYVTGRNEEDIYKKLGLRYIEPELRENRGEIEAAKKDKLPNLIKDDDVHGDFHVHSHYSDGNDSIETIANHAQNLGYAFIGVADHSQSLKIANGLSPEQVEKKISEINRLNKKFSNLRILCGTECDIKPDGTLDYPNSILKKFDYVNIGIHTAFKMSKEEMTKRIIRGMEHEETDILVHPTGRLIGSRDPYEVDIEQIIDVAKETKTFLEINAFPDRLDLNDVHAKLAKEHGVCMTIGTDSHNVVQLPYIKYGIATARRGWLEKKDILNTYSCREIEKQLGAKGS